MKILYSITKSEIGGAQVQVLQLVRHMRSLGHEVAVMSAPGGWLEQEAVKSGAIFYSNIYFSNSYNPIRLLKACRRINLVLADFKPNLVHVHSSFAGIITRLVLRGKTPTIFTAHSWAFTDGAKLARRIIAPIAERFASKYTDKIITVSDYDKHIAIRYKISSPEKIISIYNGAVPLLGVAKKENILISVGRLSYPKQFILLLKSFHMVNIPNVVLHIVGDGPDRLKIEKKILELGLSLKVKLLGKLSQDKTHQEILKSSVFVLISKHEGLPISILEAMSAGLPIIASKVGGIPEEIGIGSGILVNNNSENIKEAIETVFIGTNIKKMGDVARDRYNQKFTLKEFLNKIDNLYKEVLFARNNSNNV